MSDMIAALNAVGARRAELTKQLETEAAAILRPLLEGFLKDHPSIESLKWRQYTPYFNDGDPCEFRVRDLYVKPVGGDEDDGDYEDGFITLWIPRDPKYGVYNPENTGVPLLSAEAVDALGSALSANEEACLAAFGDHVEVTVTRDGIEVEEYSHD